MVGESYEYINVGKFLSDLSISFNIKLFIVERKCINKRLMHRKQIKLDLKLVAFFQGEVINSENNLYHDIKLIVMTRNSVGITYNCSPVSFMVQVFNYRNID